MADEVVVIPDPNAAVADTAQLAANSAERAQEAAAATMEHASVAVAGVAQQAAAQIAETQEGLIEWQRSQERTLASLAEKVQQHEQRAETLARETTERLSSILSRLEPPLASPPNPQNGPAEAVPPEGVPAAPEPAPERRRAHRWI